MNYLTAKEIKAACKISAVTLKRWKDTGVIKYKQLSSKKFLYDIDSLEQQNNSDSNEFNQRNVIYARVSNYKQKNDLEHQIEIIKNFMLSKGIVADEIYSDIGSGMNESRTNFLKLLESIFKREIKTVYISFKDRLTRFGFNYFKYIFSYFGTSICILDEHEETNKFFQKELAEDLLSMIHNYSMKLYANKKKKFKEIENIIEKAKLEDE